MTAFVRIRAASTDANSWVDMAWVNVEHIVSFQPFQRENGIAVSTTIDLSNGAALYSYESPDVLIRRIGDAIQAARGPDRA